MWERPCHAARRFPDFAMARRKTRVKRANGSNPGYHALRYRPRLRARACTHLRECWSAPGQSSATAFPPPHGGREPCGAHLRNSSAANFEMSSCPSAQAGTTSERCHSPSSNTLIVKILLDFTQSVTMLHPSRSKFEGRLPEAFCRRGTGAAPASEGLTQPSSPGRTRAASSATRSRPGPTTVKGIKAKMPRWRAARRRA
jgi:hypothetical protein